MEVILTQDVAKLGRRGEIVGVKDGYACNYLIPDKQRASAEELRAKLDGEHVKFTLAFGETGKAYGSITAKQIAEGFREKGVYFDHHQVMLDHPLKEAGAHEVKIRLFEDVIATVKVWIVPEGEPAHRGSESTGEKESVQVEDPPETLKEG
jgi:large subunit ribosomal protein L9